MCGFHPFLRETHLSKVFSDVANTGINADIISGLIPQSLQLQAQATLASLSWCHKSGQCAKSCARRSVCFCSQSGGGASIGLLT
jgi:hypothetical protein